MCEFGIFIWGGSWKISYESVQWCSSDQNGSDILSKHWDHTKVKDTVREVFDYQGDLILPKPE